jgi:hypothetical protein
MRIITRLGSILCATLLGLFLVVAVAPGQASAHERRDLLGGKYQAVVGFLNEPAYDNQFNGLDLTVVDKTQKTADGKDKPVEGLEKTLKAEVLYGGGKKMDLTLRTRFGMPGKYAAYFEPTKAGQYIFRIYGEIEGQKIDERFESGPGRFGDVEPLAALQFPEPRAQVPADLQSRLDAAQSQATTARNLGLGGVVVGLLGLAAGAAALFRRPSAAAATTPVRPAEGD